MSAPDISDIADFIIENSEPGISHRKLQKLLYFAQGFYLAKNGLPLFDAELQAWRYGPVNRKIWNLFKGHGGTEITKPTNTNYLSLDETRQTFLSSFLDVFLAISQDTLIDISHTDAPWEVNYIPALNKTIDKSELLHYFSGFTDYNEYTRIAKSKVEFMELLERRKTYLMSLPEIGTEWTSGTAEAPNETVCQAAIQVLDSLRNVTFSKHPKPALPKLAMGPIPVGGVTIELSYNDRNAYMALFNNETAEVSIEQDGYFDEQEFTLSDFNDDIGVILGRVV